MPSPPLTPATDSAGGEAPALLCVVRHGETDWNSQGVLQGWTDVPLNDQGRRQAGEIAAALADAGIAAIHTSPLVRSLETAEIVARRLGLPPPAVDEGLKERNFGVFQGVPKAELAELNPKLYRQILQRNPAGSFEQGETMDEFADRVLAALGDVARGGAGTRRLVITHGWVMDVLARQAGGLSRDAILHVKPKNGEFLWLQVSGSSIRRLPPPARRG